MFFNLEHTTDQLRHFIHVPITTTVYTIRQRIVGNSQRTTSISLNFEQYKVEASTGIPLTYPQLSMSTQLTQDNVLVYGREDINNFCRRFRQTKETKSLSHARQERDPKHGFFFLNCRLQKSTNDFGSPFVHSYQYYQGGYRNKETRFKNLREICERLYRTLEGNVRVIATGGFTNRGFKFL